MTYFFPGKGNFPPSPLKESLENDPELKMTVKETRGLRLDHVFVVAAGLYLV